MRRIICTVTATVLLTTAACALGAVSFRAGVIGNALNKASTHFTLYKSGLMERMERRDRQPAVEIVRKDRKIAWSLDTKKKQYGERALRAAERQSAVHALKQEGLRRVGREKMDGYLCDRYTHSSSGGDDTITVWYSPRLDYAVKTQIRKGRNWLVIELTSIVETKLSPSLFTIPAGYARKRAGKP